MRTFRRRLALLAAAVVTLCFTSWLELFLQKRQHVIGGGLDRVVLFVLINAHVLVILILLYAITRQAIKLFTERSAQVPGSAFTRNLLFAFSVFSVLPTFFVFFVAGRLITTSIDDWFEARVDGGLKSGVALYEEFTKNQHRDLKQSGAELENAVRTQTVSLLEDVDDQSRYMWNTGNDYASLHEHLRAEVDVWRTYRKVNDRSMASLEQQFTNHIDDLPTEDSTFTFYGSTYWAKKTLINETPTLLVIAQRHPPEIRYPLITLETSLSDYEKLRSMRNPIYWQYLIIFLVATLLILFLSVWCAFYLARGISKPMQEFLLATEQIRRGRWDAQVSFGASSDLNLLAKGFNEMTSALQQARSELERKNSEMMTIIEHINTAVFMVNPTGRIVMANAAAKNLIKEQLGVDRFKNKKISFFGSHVRDQFFTLARELIQSGDTHLTKEISFNTSNTSTLFVAHLTRVDTASESGTQGLLVVVENLTDIVRANKMKTWQEAARQMAHEIKNPLTPIQLATQRLLRRQRKLNTDDPLLAECGDTILNHVRLIRNLVGQFSEFSNLPEGKLEACDINSIVSDIVSNYEVTHPDVAFVYEMQGFLPSVNVDRRKIKQVFVNLLDNSMRALSSGSKDVNKQFTIKTSFKTGLNQIELLLSDNGPGIPVAVRDKLFLPYVSTEKKNMGLGLAIVHELVKHMGGAIRLLPGNTGATFQILLPV